MDLLNNYQLSQLIDQPTRVTKRTETLIDLVITNNKESLTHWGVVTSTISDHTLIYAVRKVRIRRRSPRFVETRNFKNFNEAKFIHYVKNSIWPTPTTDNDDINTLWSEWKFTMQNILDRHAPCRNKKNSKQTISLDQS